MTKASEKLFGIHSIDDEPWVYLPDAEALADWTHTDEVAYNQANRQAEKYRFFVNAFDYITDNQINGNYFEFGCHRARTFRMALTEARRHEMQRMKFFAFDSFEGLPVASSDPSLEAWKTPGALTTSEQDFRDIINKHGIYTDRVNTVKGFYDQSFTPQFQRKMLDEEDKVSFACVDCDLYESAVPVFRFLEPLLQEGTLIYIDDLFTGYRGTPTKGVARAFLEFQKHSRFRFVQHMNVGWWGRSYIAYIDTGPIDDVLDQRMAGNE